MSELWEHIDLTSGIGGFALAFEQANLSKPILFCEIDPFCQKILRKHWKDVPIVNDLKELAHETTKFIPRRNGRKRILSSGFPCQPWSVARRFGKHKPGKEDPRHLFPYIIDILSQERFECCVFENVPGIIAEGIDDVKNDLETQGYSSTILHCPSGTIIGKPHKRERIFIIAFNLSDTKGFRYRGWNSEKRRNEQGVIQQKEQTRDQVGSKTKGRSIFPGQEIRQSRMDQHRIDGVSERVARSIDHRDKLYNHKLKALGNSVVVPFVKHIGIAIKESFNE